MVYTPKKTVIPSINPSKVVAAQLPPIKIDPFFSLSSRPSHQKKKLRNGSGRPSEKLMEDFTNLDISREISPLYLWKG